MALIEYHDVNAAAVELKCYFLLFAPCYKRMNFLR